MSGSLGIAVRKAVTVGVGEAPAGLKQLFAATGNFNASVRPEDEVEVTYAYTGSQATQKVYTGRSRGDTPAAAMKAGRNHRNETGYFDLNILVQLPGAEVLESDERCDEIGTAIEEWIADRKGDELAIAGLQSLTVVSWAADYRQFDFGWASIRTYSVRWTARLT